MPRQLPHIPQHNIHHVSTRSQKTLDGAVWQSEKMAKVLRKADAISTAVSSDAVHGYDGAHQHIGPLSKTCLWTWTQRTGMTRRWTLIGRNNDGVFCTWCTFQQPLGGIKTLRAPGQRRGRAHDPSIVCEGCINTNNRFKIWQWSQGRPKRSCGAQNHPSDLLIILPSVGIFNQGENVVGHDLHGIWTTLKEGVFLINLGSNLADVAHILVIWKVAGLRQAIRVVSSLWSQQLLVLYIKTELWVTQHSLCYLCVMAQETKLLRLVLEAVRPRRELQWNILLAAGLIW